MILASGPSTLTVSWSAPLLYPEVVLGYLVRCAPKSDNSNIMELSRGNTRFNAQFHNLIPNTTYDCEVHTTSNFGNSTPATGTASTLPRESKFVDVSVCRINGRDEKLSLTLDVYVCAAMGGNDYCPFIRLSLATFCATMDNKPARVKYQLVQ